MCNKWLAKNEGDGIIVRDLPSSKSYVMKKYNIKVHTGAVRGAGTDANVFINLFGEKVSDIPHAFTCHWTYTAVSKLVARNFAGMCI